MTNPNGRFGIHGGQYIPETLMNAVIELEEAYNHYKNDPEFNRELTELFNEYAGRPSRLYYAEKMTRDLGGAKIYLKREDLNHTGAHKINNVLGQALLAKKMGKTRLIAETGAGQHGVATATAAALMGMECVVFMGEEDTFRQALNVYRMRLLGAEVIPVKTGTATLKDAVSEAMREWTSRISDTHYCLGSVMGPHPFPTIVRDFQAVISKEIRQQMLDLWRSVSMPLDKMKVTSEYGMRFHPIYHRSMAHNGLDFSAPTGTKVYAMLDGVIKRIGYDKRSGNFVIIDHGDYTVSYCHLSKVLVQVGERVKAGQITCLAGNTGASTGSHLHYGVRDKSGKWCNPKVMLDMVDKTRKTVLELIRQHGGLDA